MKVKLKFPRRMTANDKIYEKDSVHEFDNPSSISRWKRRGCVEVKEEEKKVEVKEEKEENVKAKEKKPKRGRQKKKDEE